MKIKSLSDAKIYELVRSHPSNRCLIRITCACGATADHPGSKLKPPAAAKIFREKNWQVDAEGRSAKCPRCHHMKPKSSTTTTGASQRARKAQRALYRLLEEHFDEDTGRYAPGWSDSEIAKETGLSESAVAEFRNDAFGLLAVDPAIEDITERLEATERNLTTEKAAIVKMMQDLDRETGQKLAAIKVDLMAISKGHKPVGSAA